MERSDEGGDGKRHAHLERQLHDGGLEGTSKMTVCV